jgi:PST family polysaccharide transporter
VKSAYRATAILASGSAVTVVVGLVSAKVWALLVGPAGIGLLGLMMSLVGLGGIVASLGIGTGLVREGANALGRQDLARAAVIQRAAYNATLALAAVAAVAFLALRRPISGWMLGGSEHAASVPLLGLAVALTLIAGIQTSTLNAHHQVSALARFAVVNSLVGAALSLSILWFWRELGIPYAVLSTTTVSAVLATWMTRRRIETVPYRPSPEELRDASRSLLRFGIPFTASALVGSGVQLALPILVLHLLDTESVGFYRAAVSLSVGYLGFLLTAMAQDYYPRVSRVSGEPEKLRELVNQQLHLITAIGAPIVILGLALAPLLVPLVYAPSFRPAVPVLEWQMVGNLFKFWSWTMSFVILARSGSRVFFFTEFVGGMATLGASWIGVRLFGLPGMGIAYLAAYLIYAAVVWAVVRKEIRFALARRNMAPMLTALLASLVVLVLPFTPLHTATIPVAVALAVLVLLACGSAVWRLIPRTRAA